MKLKNNLIYIISFMFSIYISYLICGLYELKVQGIIFITFFDIGISLYLTYLWKKNVKYKNMKFKTKIIISIVSILIAVIILILNWNILTNKFTKTSVIINSKNLDVVNNNLIQSISVNNTSYTVNNNKCVDNNRNESTYGIKISVLDEHTLRIDFEKYVDIKIIFNSQTENINVQDGDILSTIEFQKDTYLYSVQSNSYADSIFIFRIILSLATIVYIVNLLIISIFYINKEKRFMLTTMVICAIGAWIYYGLLRKSIVYGDSPSYIYFNFHEFLNGKFSGRVPIYPLVIRICEKIFGNQFLEFVCILQYMVCFISIIFLYKLLKLLIKNEKIIMLVVILYGLCPSIIDWNNVIMTESLSLSFTVIFIYFLVKYIKKPDFKVGSIAIAIALISTFTKPTLIIYVLLLEIFWLARFIFDRKNVKTDIKCFVLSTISIIFIVIYAIIFHKTFGIYSISDAIPRQDLYICIQEGYYKNSDNEQFIKNIEDAIKNNPYNGVTDCMWDAMTEVKDKYSLNELKKLTNYCRLKSMPDYIDYLNDLFKTNASAIFGYYSFDFIDTNLNWLKNTLTVLFEFITFAHIYIIICIEFVLFIYYWIKNKSVPWINCVFFAFQLAIIVSTFIGTNAEFMRTALCVLPFAYICVAIYIDKISTKAKEEVNSLQ